jgi:hypothetical protein
MIMEAPDKEAPIVPGVRLGGFELGRNIREYEDTTVPHFIRGKLKLRLPQPFRACYTFGDWGIEIRVDVTDGKIVQIAALKGYRGTLLGEIRVGMPAGDAIRLAPSLYWDGLEARIYSQAERGVFLDIGGSVPESIVSEMTIESIVVFATTATGVSVCGQ